jgi:hypothetical protein
MTVFWWQREQRGIPPHIPLALEALDHDMKKEGKNGVIVGMS